MFVITIQGTFKSMEKMFVNYAPFTYQDAKSVQALYHVMIVEILLFIKHKHTMVQIKGVNVKILNIWWQANVSVIQDVSKPTNT